MWENQPTTTVALFRGSFSGSILVSRGGAILVSGHKNRVEKRGRRNVNSSKSLRRFAPLNWVVHFVEIGWVPSVKSLTRSACAAGKPQNSLSVLIQSLRL